MNCILSFSYIIDSLLCEQFSRSFKELSEAVHSEKLWRVDVIGLLEPLLLSLSYSAYNMMFNKLCCGSQYKISMYLQTNSG